jgi:hypothetical protein
LLASDTVADHALFALRKVAEERVGERTDALLDGNLDYTMRYRLARVFGVCVSQRAADGLALATSAEASAKAEALRDTLSVAFRAGC